MATEETEQMQSQQMQELVDSLERDVPGWQPEPNDILAGRIVDIETRTSEYGPYPAITVEKESGEKQVFHAFRTVALNEILRLRPQVGDLIAIRYFGLDAEHDYHNYKVRVQGREGRDFGWDDFQPKVKTGSERQM